MAAFTSPLLLELLLGISDEGVTPLFAGTVEVVVVVVVVVEVVVVAAALMALFCFSAALNSKSLNS
jgi:hypothetical protein